MRDHTYTPGRSPTGKPPQSDGFWILEKNSGPPTGGIGALGLLPAARWQLFYLAGVDGGRIGEPTPALDYLLRDLDGGAL